MDGEKLEERIADSVERATSDPAQKTDQTQNTEVNEGASPETQPQAKENNWTTSLPKEYREEAAKYGSFKELLDATLGKEKPGERQLEHEDKPEKENWDTYLESLGDGKTDPTLLILKESGVDVESARKVMQGVKSHNDNLVTEAKNNLGANMKVIWGKDYETRSAAMDRGINAIGDRKLIKEMFESGQMLNPYTLNLISLLGMNTTEAAPAAGQTPIAPKAKVDQNNPYGFSQ